MNQQLDIGFAGADEARRLYLLFNPGEEQQADGFAASYHHGSIQTRLIELAAEGEQASP